MNPTAIFGAVWLGINVPAFLVTITLLFRYRRLHPLCRQSLTVLFLFLTSIFTLGFWLSLSRVLADELPCRASSVVFFPLTVLVVCLIKHILWNTYMRHYTSDAMLLNTVYSQSSETAMMLDTGSVAVAPLPRKVKFGSIYFQRLQYLFGVLIVCIFLGLLISLDWSMMLSDPACKSSHDSVDYMYYLIIVDAIVSLIFFSVVLSHYPTTAVTARQNTWLAAAFITTMVFWTLFLVLPVLDDINSEYEVTVMLVCAFCTCTLLIFGVWPLFAVYRAKRIAGDEEAGPEASVAKLRELLLSPADRDGFARFLRSEFAIENLVFYETAQKYSDYLARALQRKVVDSDGVSRMLGMAECIYMSYLDGSAPLQVNIPHHIIRDIRAELDKIAAAQGGGDAATVDVDEGCVQAADSGVFAPHAVEANKDRKKSLGESGGPSSIEAINISADGLRRPSRKFSNIAESISMGGQGSASAPRAKSAMARRMDILAHIFDAAQSHVLVVMATDSFRRYKKKTLSSGTTI